MSDDTIKTADATMAGCWIDGHLGQYIYGEIVKIAEEYGYRASASFGQAYDRENGGLDPDEIIIHESELATDWLNEHVAEDGYTFGWSDGEFYYQADAWWQEESW